ncbi:MAG: LptE family protein [Candidatus Omnitrophota bacterium]
MKNKTIKIVQLCLSFSLIFICGCGYTTKAYNLPSSIKTVYIDTFANNSDEPNIENELRVKLANAFQDEGHIKITDKAAADTILTGKINSYARQAMRYANDETIEEYRLTITVNFEFKQVVSQEIIVKANNFTADTSYYLSGSSAKSEKSARTDAIDELAHRILNKIVTLW